MGTLFGEAYCSIALRINKLLPGYVTYYYGPDDIRRRAEQGKTSPQQLLSEVEQLRDLIDEEDRTRRVFLQKEVGAMETVVRKLLGEQFDYKEEVRRLYDVEPTKISEKEVSSIKDELRDLFGSSDLGKSLQEWRSSRQANIEQIKTIVDFLRQEFSKRSHELLPLPKEEECTFGFVWDKPWRGYRTYLSYYRSRVDINLDAPVSLLSLPALVAHESYPGHHVEACLKEKFLFAERGLLEASASIINSPQRVISNSIGEIALDMICDDAQAIYRRLGREFSVEASDRDLRIMELLRRLRHTRKNASLMLHDEGKTKDEVLEYLVDVGLQDPQSAKIALRFLTRNVYRCHTFCYFDMADIMRKILTKIKKNILKLYVTQFCPSQINDVFP